ncbi:MAG: hypothetical protein QG577_1506 [Thermodesulfobacteriota bacterium]|nr:hypothetical protein [Thermodesulfobacteriota bacterium]
MFLMTQAENRAFMTVRSGYAIDTLGERCINLSVGVFYLLSSVLFNAPDHWDHHHCEDG